MQQRRVFVFSQACKRWCRSSSSRTTDGIHNLLAFASHTHCATLHELMKRRRAAARKSFRCLFCIEPRNWQFPASLVRWFFHRSRTVDRFHPGPMRLRALRMEIAGNIPSHNWQADRWLMMDRLNMKKLLPTLRYFYEAICTSIISIKNGKRLLLSSVVSSVFRFVLQ